MGTTLIGRDNSRQIELRPHARRRRGQDETISMESKRFGYFPHLFIWRGHHYHVQAIERCWTVSRRWLWQVERHCFRVRCAEGMFELYQDVKNNTWHVEHFERH